MLFHFMAATVDGVLAPPTAPTAAAAPGVGDGKVSLTVSALPVSWGDLATPGDAAGTAGILQWWNEVDGWQTLSTPAATGTTVVDVSPLLHGLLTTIRVRGRSAGGRDGIARSLDVIVPPVPTPPTGNGIGDMQIGTTFKV